MPGLHYTLLKEKHNLLIFPYISRQLLWPAGPVSPAKHVGQVKLVMLVGLIIPVVKMFSNWFSSQGNLTFDIIIYIHFYSWGSSFLLALGSIHLPL